MSLAVFPSLYNVLVKLKEEGYSVEVPATVDAMRERLLGGNAARYGTSANVHARIPANDYMRSERWLKQVEKQWGPAPGRHQSDGATVFILGEQFGNVFVGVQPAFGYEGDPMRLLFERGFAPTHAFSRLLSLICAKISKRTRSCISARMARWSSCLASRPVFRKIAGRIASSAICRTSISTRRTTHRKARSPSGAAPPPSSAI